jgi:hypothetical protein
MLPAEEVFADVNGSNCGNCSGVTLRAEFAELFASATWSKTDRMLIELQEDRTKPQ